MRIVYQRVVPRGEGPKVEDSYSDFREVDGIRVPFKVTSVSETGLSVVTVVKKLEYNTGLKRDELAIPPESANWPETQ